MASPNPNTKTPPSLKNPSGFDCFNGDLDNAGMQNLSKTPNQSAPLSIGFDPKEEEDYISLANMEEDDGEEVEEVGSVLTKSPFDRIFSGRRKINGEEEMGSVPTNIDSNCFYSFDINDLLFVFDWEVKEAEEFGFGWEAREEAEEETDVDLSLRLRYGVGSPNGDLSVQMSTGFDRKEEEDYIRLRSGEEDDGEDEEEAEEFGFDWEAKEEAKEKIKVDLSLRLNSMFDSSNGEEEEEAEEFGFDWVAKEEAKEKIEVDLSLRLNSLLDSSNGDLSLHMITGFDQKEEEDYISLGNGEKYDGEGEEEMGSVPSKGPFDRFYSGLRKTDGEEVELEMEMGSVPANRTSNCLYSLKSPKTEELHTVLTRALRERVLEDEESES